MARGGMMGSFWLGAFAAVLSTAAHAYTPEQEQMCTGDAMRLCSADIPDVERVTACMVRLRAQLSPGCRQFFRDAEPQVTPVSAGKPLPITARSAKARKSKRKT